MGCDREMNFPQILFGFYFAILGAYLSVVLARVLKQNGRVLERMDEGFKKTLNKTDEGFRMMDEGFRMMDDRVEQRHREVIELIKVLAKA